MRITLNNSEGNAVLSAALLRRGLAPIPNAGGGRFAAQWFSEQIAERGEAESVLKSVLSDSILEQAEFASPDGQFAGIVKLEAKSIGIAIELPWKREYDKDGNALY